MSKIHHGLATQFYPMFLLGFSYLSRNKRIPYFDPLTPVLPPFLLSIIYTQQLSISCINIHGIYTETFTAVTSINITLRKHICLECIYVPYICCIYIYFDFCKFYWRKRTFLFNGLVVINISQKYIYSQTVRIIKHVSRNSTILAWNFLSKITASRDINLITL